jgi:hypothetical protein
MMIQGQNYAGKLYNFVLLTWFKLEMRYLFGAGLLVPKSKLPFHILKDMDSASVTMKSSSSDFKRMEFPDRIENTTEGLLIIIDPIPEINEVFKITIV